MGISLLTVMQVTINSGSRYCKLTAICESYYEILAHINVIVHTWDFNSDQLPYDLQCLLRATVTETL